MNAKQPIAIAEAKAERSKASKPLGIVHGQISICGWHVTRLLDAVPVASSMTRGRIQERGD